MPEDCTFRWPETQPWVIYWASENGSHFKLMCTWMIRKTPLFFPSQKRVLEEMEPGFGTWVDPNVWEARFS